MLARHKGCMDINDVRSPTPNDGVGGSLDQCGQLGLGVHLVNVVNLALSPWVIF